MEPYGIKNAAFSTSVGLGQGYPAPLPCEIAVVGKSNVGKSSLINSITGNHKLARTSQTPGKTRLINFFTLTGTDNEKITLVDLPGYGYAKASKTEQKSWGELIEAYLASGRVKHLFLLLDIRHEPTMADKQMFSYILYYCIPFTLVATKADKLAKSRRQQAANLAAKLLGAPPAAISFSSETGEGRQALMDRMRDVMKDCKSA